MEGEGEGGERGRGEERKRRGYIAWNVANGSSIYGRNSILV